MAAIKSYNRISAAAQKVKAGNIVAMPTLKKPALKPQAKVAPVSVQLSQAARAASSARTVTLTELTAPSVDLGTTDKVRTLFPRPVTVDLRRSLASVADDPTLLGKLKALADAGRLGSLKGQGTDIISPAQLAELGGDLVTKLEGMLDVRLPGDASAVDAHSALLGTLAKAGKIASVSTRPSFPIFTVGLPQLIAAGTEFWGRFNGKIEVRGTPELFSSQAGWAAATTIDNLKNADLVLVGANGATPLAPDEATLSLSYRQFVNGRHLVSKFKVAPSVSVTDVPAIRARDVAALPGVSSVAITDKASEIAAFGGELERLSARGMLSSVVSSGGEDLRLTGTQVARMPTALGKLANARFSVTDGPFSPTTYARMSAIAAERMASTVDITGNYAEVMASFEGLGALQAAGKLGNLTVTGSIPSTIEVSASALARSPVVMERILDAAPSSAKLRILNAATVAEAASILGNQNVAARVPSRSLAILEDGRAPAPFAFTDLAAVANDKIGSMTITGPLRVTQLEDLQATTLASKVSGIRIEDEISAVAASTADYAGSLVGSIEARGLLPVEDLASFGSAKRSKIAGGIRVSGTAAQLAGGTTPEAVPVKSTASSGKLRLLTITGVAPSDLSSFDWAQTAKIRHALEIVGTSTQVLAADDAIMSRVYAGNVARITITNDLAPGDLADFDHFANAGVALSLPVAGSASAVMSDSAAILRAARAGSLSSIDVEDELPPAAVETLGRDVLKKVRNGAVLSGSPADIIKRMDLLSDAQLLPTLREIRPVGAIVPSDLAKFTPTVLAKTTNLRLLGSAGEIIEIMGQLDALASNGKLAGVKIIGPLVDADRAKFTPGVLEAVDLSAWTAAQVAAMTTDQIVALGTAQVAAMTIAQTAALTTAQVAALETRDLAALRTAQIAAMTTAQMTAVTTAQIAALTTAQIAALETRDLVALTTAQIAALTTAQVAALTTGQVAALETPDIAALTTAQTAALTTVQVAALTTSQTVALTTAQIAAVTTAQTVALTTAQVAALTTDQTVALGTAQVAALTTSRTVALTTAQIAAMTTAQIMALGSAQAAALTTAQIGALSTAQIAAMTTGQIAALVTAQAASLSTAQIGALSTAQVVAMETADLAALTTDQITALTTAQVAALTTDQTVVLTTAQVAALETIDLAALTTAQIAALTTAQVAAVTTAQVPAVTTAQVAALTTAQIAAVTAAQIAAVTTEQIAAVTTDQIAAITTDQIAAITTDQIGALTTAQVAALAALGI